MKKIISALAVVALMAPSVASASTAADALSVSVKSAAVQPVRAAAKPGKAKAVSTPVLILGAIAAVAGIILIADGSDSK